MLWTKFRKILKKPKTNFGLILLLLGVLCLAIAVGVTPTFAVNYLTADHSITSKGVQLLNIYRLYSALLGIGLIFLGAILTKVKRFFIPNDTIVLVLGMVAWAILFGIYLSTHQIPVNPAGFYLEAARQLAQNGYHIPAYVTGFGEQGIPFAFPPLGIYVYASGGKLLGGITTAALWIPGILLPIQAFSAYKFVKQFSGSNQAAQWCAVFLLLIPHLFYRTLYGDGITTGLSGIFLLLAWYFAIKPLYKPVPYLNFIIGGLMVGLSILSHPGIGLFCAVSFTILSVSQNGFTLRGIIGWFVSGITALIMLLPWLFPVLSMHGLDPFLAALKDEKSAFSMLSNVGDSLSYIYTKHLGDQSETSTLLLFPFVPSMIYTIIWGPRVILFLLLAAIFTFKGHPSVTMFLFATSIGIFYKDVFDSSFGSQRLLRATKADVKLPFESWRFFLFGLAHVMILFMLCFPYTLTSTLSPAEQETYSWIRANTDPDSSFLIQGMDENLVYFGQRTILLPTLGAEWVPDAEYGNGLQRNSIIKNKIFACRELNCLRSLFEKYAIAADYIIFRVSSKEEKLWVDRLAASSAFEIVYQSGRIVILRCLSCYPTPPSLDAPPAAETYN